MREGEVLFHLVDGKPSARTVMRIGSSVWILVVLHGAGVAAVDSPRLLFDRGQIASLRQQIAQPQFAPIWARILAEAESYCDPASARYANPADPCSFAAKQDRMDQKRHDALLVHTIGRQLTGRMEALGFAYQLTGRKELGRHGAALLAATVERYPVTHPVVAQGFAGGRGDIMRGLALGYDLVGECLDATQRRLVNVACADYVEAFLKEFNDPEVWWYRVHNYNGVNGGAAGCLALALQEAFPDRAEGWVPGCQEIVRRWLEAGFDEDGAYLEGVAYSSYGLSNTVLFAEALRRSRQGDLFGHPTLRKLPAFYALSLLPGERVYDARNDSSYGGLDATLLKLAEASRSGLCRWLWDQSGEDQSFLRILWDNQVPPVDPRAAGVPLAQHFRGRGLCVWRTGWTGSDVMFSIEAGRYHPVTHNQADKGHFTLYGLGARWATDTGYANEHGPEGRGQTLGHSCVLIDGQGQSRSGAGWGTSGEIVKAASDELHGYGYALADCTAAYNQNSGGVSGTLVEHARRHALFVYPHQGAPAYAVILDDIRKDDRPHDYTWQLMYDDQTAVILGDGRARFEPIHTSGKGYVDSLDRTAPGGGRGQCAVAFPVAESGEYVLWGRVRAGSTARGTSDSFFVAIDGGTPFDWHLPGKREWTWARISSGAKQDAVTCHLRAGEHRVVLAVREPGTQIDCLWLTRDQQATPSLPQVRETGLFAEAESGQWSPPMRCVPAGEAAARLVVRIDAAAATALSTGLFRPVDYHKPAEFPRLRATVRAVNPRFLTLLLPLPGTIAEPEVRFESRERQRLAVIRWSGHCDSIAWPEGDGTVQFHRD